MNKKQAAKGSAAERCLCMGVGPKLTEMLECKSEAATSHMRNARIEFLKGLRALIDDRIRHLSRETQKGTAVPVE